MIKESPFFVRNPNPVTLFLGDCFPGTSFIETEEEERDAEANSTELWWRPRETKPDKGGDTQGAGLAHSGFIWGMHRA